MWTKKSFIKGGNTMEVLVFPKNEEKALQMEKYMKNLFHFAGVPKPERALCNSRYWMKANIYLFLKF